jgi:hypothetical protein
LLPHSYFWKHIPLNLLHAHVTILVSFFRIPMEMRVIFFLVHHLVAHPSKRKGYKVPEVELPRCPEYLVLTTFHRPKNTILFVPSEWFFLLSEIFRLPKLFCMFCSHNLVHPRLIKFFASSILVRRARSWREDSCSWHKIHMFFFPTAL